MLRKLRANDSQKLYVFLYPFSLELVSRKLINFRYHTRNLNDAKCIYTHIYMYIYIHRYHLSFLQCNTDSFSINFKLITIEINPDPLFFFYTRFFRVSKRFELSLVFFSAASSLSFLVSYKVDLREKYVTRLLAKEFLFLGDTMDLTE